MVFYIILIAISAIFTCRLNLVTFFRQCQQKGVTSFAQTLLQFYHDLLSKLSRCSIHDLIFCMLDSLRSSQQFSVMLGWCLPELNQF